MELVELNSLNHNQQHRERAVDVPESFIAVVKQAPRYPPPQSDQKYINKKEFNKPSFNYQNININNNKVGYEPERLLKYSEEIERRKKSQEEFLRTSLRSSIKLNSNGRSLATKSFKESRNAIVNDAFEDEDYSSLNNLPNLNIVLDNLITNLNDNKFKELVDNSNLENNLKIYQTIVDNNQKNKADLVGNLNLLSSDDLLFEAICILRLQDDPSLNQEVLELFNILSDSNFKMLFSTFEEIYLKMKRDLNNSIDSDNLMKINKLRNLDDLKIVNLKKSNCEPLGITIKSDMDGSVVIGRIVKGGTADKSGLLNENEEILEINGIELRGRNLSQICDMLSDMNGTLTFVIAPKDSIRSNMQKSTFIHLKALYDYDPEDDIYIPCRELGICFNKGDILHVIDQTDQNWWQAYKEGEHEQNLAGLIPSIYFQIQRESMKKSLINETDSNKYKNKKSILCGLKRKKKNNFKNDINEEILTYEEVHLYYPKANMKRPIVLIGPTNIGRHELRQRIMLDTERFAAAVPHTSRNRRDGEMDGVDYHFITRNEFELYIRQGKFVEHGQYEGNYYGTSLGAIEAVVQSGKICLLNLHVHSIHILRQSPAGAKLKPYFVFVAPPNQLDKLIKLIAMTTHNTFETNLVSNKDLHSIIEEAKEIENKYGHFFDMILTMTDIDKAYHELLKEINTLERESQWIPKIWLKDKTPFPRKTYNNYSNINESKWLIASQINNLNFNTFNQCICLADLFNQNENNLLIGDFGNDNNIRLIVIKGTQVQNQIKLADYPVSVLSFSMETNLKVPLIAVASGKSIFIYKNFKPFYKFTLSSNTLNIIETEVWSLFKEDKISSLELYDKLDELQTNLHKVLLSTKTQALLEIEKSRLDLIDKFLLFKKEEPLILEDYVTCMNKIQKSVSQDKQVCYLVIGTESCNLLIIETEAFTINSSYKLPSQPVFIETYGFFDTDYIIIVSCRDSSIHTFKRNYKKPKLIIQLSSQCCSIIRINDKIYVGCLDCTLACYNLKGFLLWDIKQPASIVAMAKIKIEIFGIKLIAVSLSNKEIFFYNDKQLCDKIIVDEIISCLKFGKFGREEHTLIMISNTGKLTIAILKRTANFNVKEKNSMNEIVFNTSKLKLPKKTKYFVHQTVRERDNSTIIHQTFQQDLHRLKLISSRAYVKAINNCLNPISSNDCHPIKLSAQVHGLGPIFKLVLELKNISADQPTENLYLCFNCDLKIYKILPNFVFVPFLSPGYTYNLENKVELITDLGLTESIKIFVCKKNEKIPLITAVINMPKSEQFV